MLNMQHIFIFFFFFFNQSKGFVHPKLRDLSLIKHSHIAIATMGVKLPPRVSNAIAKVTVMYRTPEIEHC